MLTRVILIQTTQQGHHSISRFADEETSLQPDPENYERGSSCVSSQ
jgi:hypothetical protein